MGPAISKHKMLLIILAGKRERELVALLSLSYISGDSWSVRNRGIRVNTCEVSVYTARTFMK